MTRHVHSTGIFTLSNSFRHLVSGEQKFGNLVATIVLIAQMEKEPVKRLAPTKDTLTLLFSLSGNLCAFPGCTRPLFDGNNTFIAQVCHIESASEGGERFNAGSDNEERRQYSNLVIMCYEHHKVTDNVDIYTVDRMRQMKIDHEDRFRNLPRYASLSQIDQVTEIEKQKSVDRIENNTEKIIAEQSEQTRMLKQLMAAVGVDNNEKAAKTDFDRQIDGIISLRTSYQHKAAVTLLQKMIEEDWKNLSDRERYRVTANLGILHLDLLDNQKAAKCFINSYSYQPEDPKAIGWAIIGYSLMDDSDGAKELIRKGLEMNPNDVSIYGAMVRLNKSLPLQEIIEMIPSVVRQNTEVAFEIARAAQIKGEHNAAITWGQIALDNASDNKYELRAVLGTIILESIRSPFHVVTSQISHDTRSKAGYIIELYSQAWDEIKNTDLRESRVWFLINRAVARTYLGDYEGCYQDAKEALSHKRDSFSLRHVALAAAKTKREKEAFAIISELKSMLSGNDLYEVEHFHGQLYLQIGEPAKALEIFDELLQQDISQSLRLFITNYLCQHQINIGDIQRAEYYNELAIALDPGDLTSQVLKGKIAVQNKKPEEARDIFNHIFSAINYQTPEVDIYDLSLEFEKLEMNGQAIALMEKVANLEIYSDHTQKLLKLYFRSGEYGKLLSACHGLTEQYGPIASVTELKAYVLAEINDFPGAISTCLAHLKVYPQDQAVQARLGFLYSRKEEWEKVREIVDNIDHLDRTLGMDLQYKIAMLCHDSGRIEKFRRFSMQTRRQFMDQVSTHETFINLGTVVSPLREHPENPNVVGIDSQVTITSGQHTVTYRIENRPDLSRSQGELSLDSAEAKELLGKKVGDEVILGPQLIRYTVADISHIFNAALRESHHLIETTFASQTSFRHIQIGDTGNPEEDFKALFESLDRRSAIDNNIADTYRKNLLPISTIAGIRDTNMIMIWKSFIADEKLGIFTAWDSAEIPGALKALKTRKSLMIDATALCTLAQIGALKEIELLGLELLVSESSVVLIHEFLHEIKVDSQTGKLELGKDGDRYVRNFTSPEFIQAEITLFSDLLSWIREHCKSLPCTAALKINAQEKEKLNKALGRSTIDSIITAKEQGSLLLVEETAMRVIAGAHHGVQGIATFMILVQLFVNRKITRQRYADLSIGLLGLNYKHIPVDKHIMIAAAKKTRYLFQHPLPQVTRGMLSPIVSDDFTVKLVCDYFISLYQEPVNFVFDTDIDMRRKALMVHTLEILGEKFLMEEFMEYILHCLSGKITKDTREYQVIRDTVVNFCSNS